MNLYYFELFFRHGVEHIRNDHPETLTRDKNAPCISCPKLFGRMDHLKKHVWSHVNRVNPGVPPHFVSADPRKPKPLKPSNRTKKVANQSTSQENQEDHIDDVALNNMIRFKIDPDEFPDGVDWSTQTW